jgi:hypothetical protein
MAPKKTNAGSILASIAGITAAAIGGYYLYGHKDAETNRAKVRGWMLRAKGDVLDELEKVGEVTESAYTRAVDAVATKYRELRNIEPEELNSFIEEMRQHWQGIKQSIEKRTTGHTKTPKAPVKKNGARKSSKNE